jgi:hypothetical protein
MRTTTSAIAQSTWLALAPKDFLRHYYIRYSGPGGLTEQDDMENWNYASAASKGIVARRYPYNYQMGMGYEGTHPAVPGVVTVGISEQNQRGFYKRWVEFMAAQSWADLVLAGVGVSARGK